MITAILIDPQERAVTRVEIDPAHFIDEVCRLIEAPLFAVVEFDNGFGGGKKVQAFVDDEGLFKEPAVMTLIEGRPLAGKVLLVGQCDDPLSDDVAESVDFDTDAVYERIKFVSADVARTILARHRAAMAAQFAARGLHVEGIGDFGLFITGGDR